MKNLNIVGIGTKRFSQITLESLEVLKSSEAICFIETSEELLKQYLPNTPKLVNLDPYYKTDRTDLENYKDMMKTILKTLDSHNNISFIVAGHPRLGVFLTKALETWGQAKNISVRVYEGISSFDVMANTLQLDILENGTSIVDVNRALLFEHKLNTQCDHFFYHVCSVANPVADYLGQHGGNRLDLLKNYLLNFYNQEHSIYLVKAANSSRESSQAIPYRLRDLDQLSEMIDFSTTLFIPAQKSSETNEEIMQIMKKAGVRREHQNLL
ncbi:SAM-dependent methyltransferase [Bdellovibrio sp. HCB337]|uniref:SAM-dependent methyltransferase n=1 Tax=Bdellovibrio sp. HCB337 TaxID=3394358 RepID=UPI0039A60232